MSYQQIWKLIIQSHMRCSYFVLSVFQGWCWYCCESSTECIQAGITMETNGCFSPWLSNEQTCRPHGERQKIPCCKCKPENQCLPKYITTLFKSNRHLNYSGNKEALIEISSKRLQVTIKDCTLLLICMYTYPQYDILW